jgi:prolyl 4-hydroxylase
MVLQIPEGAIVRSNAESKLTIFEVQNLVTHEECQHLIEAAGGQPLHAARVADAEATEGVLGRTAEGRTAKVTCLENNVVLDSIVQRTAEMLLVDEKCFERAQIVHYCEGDEYRWHYDAFDMECSQKVHTTVRGQRLLTVILYLNDVNNGGETSFKHLELSVKPVEGSALVFENVASKKMKPHRESLHSGK